MSESTQQNRERESVKTDVEIIFKSRTGEQARIETDLKSLLYSSEEDFFDALEQPCTSASCNNESQNFCDCGSNYDDYEITDIRLIPSPDESTDAKEVIREAVEKTLEAIYTVRNTLDIYARSGKVDLSRVDASLDDLEESESSIQKLKQLLK